MDKDRVLMNWYAENELENIAPDITKCRAMITYLYGELGATENWEKNIPDRLKIKEELFSFADIALDYIVKIDEAIASIAERCEIIKAPVTDQSTQGARKTIQPKDTITTEESQLGGF